MKKIVDGNTACSRTAYLFSELCSIYPITPSSPMASNIDSLRSTGLKNLFNDVPRVIEMQSEAGAAGAFHGALLTGSLASTFTASQGLLLMIPNMYKIAGECLPGVMHVASRTLATHALSIFGDHQDVYATRNTGFCILSSTNVEDASLLSAVAHLSSIEGSLPFLHFFDGFRTSHEINTIDEYPDTEFLKLINFDKINEYKNRVLNGLNKVEYGMAENEDIYFQSVEARNSLYNEMPDIVNHYMEKINEFTNKDYKPFNYYGADDAQDIIVAMGSVVDTIKLVVDKLNSMGKKVGVINVHLYRPFSKKYFMDVLPKTVKNIAVIDRTKEPGSSGEPLYLDVVSILNNKGINIVGGRYGLSSKDTDPSQINAVYNMLEGNLKNNFTIGIKDDITNLSLDSVPIDVNLNCNEIKIYGFGSDGMVSASKDILKILGKDNYVQGYFEYDSKKSGGVTVSNLRVSNNKINAPFYVVHPKLVVVTKDEYFNKFNMLDNIEDNGILLINTIKNELEINNLLSNRDKEIIKNKNILVYYINATKIAYECNIKGKINKIMEMVILKLLGLDNSKDILESGIRKIFKTKGEDVINNNILALDKSLDELKIVENLEVINNNSNIEDFNIIEKINRRMGNALSVSEVKEYSFGKFPGGLSKYEKRGVSEMVPVWDKSKCIECNQCSFVCPHAVIRPLLIDEAGKDSITDKEKKFYLAISEKDCTGCGLCVSVCPTKALELSHGNVENLEIVNKYFDTYENNTNLNKFSVKGSQFNHSKFEFSGACSGCGETNYIKLLTQLFGDKLVIANATGCSSIYGGSAPSTPYSIPWANSLFEDNAEFAYGIYNSYKLKRERIINIINESINSVEDNIKDLYQEYLNNIDDYDKTYEIMNKLKDTNIPKDLKDLLSYMPKKSVFAIGGDGWAYDIGFGGIDHVLSSGEDINILVLDTEVYSNTGGQASKSSRIGQVCEFADLGKKTVKKDLFKIAMNYPNCYVASVSYGADFMGTIRALKEAEEHNGPSIVICYSPCVEHGIKGGMTNSISEGKKSVEVGYTLLMRYNPEEDKLYMDSKEPDFSKYEEFLDNEVRFNSLKIKDESKAKELLEEQKNNAIKRYNYFKKLI